MNQDYINGKWKEIKGEIQKKWGEITNDEIVGTKGDLKAISGLLIQKYGIAKEEAENRLSLFFKSIEGNFDEEKKKILEKSSESIEKVKEAIKKK